MTRNCRSEIKHVAGRCWAASPDSRNENGLSPTRRLTWGRTRTSTLGREQSGVGRRSSLVARCRPMCVRTTRSTTHRRGTLGTLGSSHPASYAAAGQHRLTQQYQQQHPCEQAFLTGNHGTPFPLQMCVIEALRNLSQHRYASLSSMMALSSSEVIRKQSKGELRHIR